MRHALEITLIRLQETSHPQYPLGTIEINTPCQFNSPSTLVSNPTHPKPQFINSQDHPWLRIALILGLHLTKIIP